MKLKLNSLKIEYFKGIKHFEIAPNGGNLAILGKNKSGKTTTYDAFLWLLFGKNSAGEAKFTIKPTNMPIETENSVEAEFTVDDKVLVLRKVYASKFVKSTGEYKTSELECYINGVPKKIREYENAIAEIIGEEQFKLLTNPKQFTENLEWKKRRELLFSISGSKTEVEIARENTIFSAIESDLEYYGNSTNLLKAVSAQVKNNSERINVLPKLINENSANLSGVTETEEALNVKYAALQNNKTAMTEMLGKLKAWKPETSKRSEILSELSLLESHNTSCRNAQLKAFGVEQNKYQNELNTLKIKLADAEREYESNNIKIKLFTDSQAKLEENKAAIKIMEWSGDTVCPTCKQNIPLIMIEQAKRDFSRNREQLLSENIAKLIEIKKKIDVINSLQVTISANINHFKAEISQLEKSAPIQNITDMPEYSKRLEQLKSELENYPETTVNPHLAEIESLVAEISDVDREIDENTILLNAVKLDVKTNARIAELRAEQQSLRVNQAQLQQKLDICNDFIKYKTDSITEKINSMFKVATFKLFEPNKTNDGLTECCEPVAFGANRYNDINTAGKVLVGIDVISTLAKHYNLSVPLFVDNIDGLDSTSYEQLINAISDSMQLITLRVSENETLTTEEF